MQGLARKLLIEPLMSAGVGILRSNTLAGNWSSLWDR